MRSSIAKKLTNVSTLYYLFVLKSIFRMTARKSNKNRIKMYIS